MASPTHTKVSSMCLPENLCTTSCSMFSPSKVRHHHSLPNSPCTLRSHSHHHHHHTSCGRGKLVEVPLWFHGLMERKVAEELLLKSPFRGPSGKEGLFLVRQSSNRGGHFVISVCTRNHCNHYLIETIESMFYVRRDRSEDRGRDIQACDLRNLIQCYRTTPLDESGLVLKEPLLRTTPVTITTSLLPLPQPRDNHNYIPLHVEHKEYVANQDYAAPDPVMLSFCEGELLTVLQKDNKNWWFGHNDRRELGYIPAALLRSLTESQPTEKSAFLNAGYVGNEEASKSDTSGIDTSSFPLTDCNSNFVSENQNKASMHMQRIHTVPCGLTMRNCGNEDIYVSSEYITSCLENRDRWTSPELPRLGVLRCVSPRQLQRHLSEPTAWIDFSVKPERLIDVEPQDLMHFSDMSPDASPTHTFSGRKLRHKAARQNSSPARGSNISSAESSPVRSKKDSMSDYMTRRDYDPIETYLRLSECTTGPTRHKGKSDK